MKTLRTLFLGFASALALCIFEYAIAYNVLNPSNLGTYSDPLLLPQVYSLRSGRLSQKNGYSQPRLLSGRFGFIVL
jgi:hypothetical protein